MGYLIVLRGMEGVCKAEYLTTDDQKVPNSPVKNIFLEKAETTIKLGIKCWFGDLSLAQVNPF